MKARNVNWIGLQTFISREVARMFRVWIQVLVAPWSSALLYIFIFGRIVGARIGLIENVAYIDFVLPGLVMLNLINSSFLHSSSSLYFMRFVKHIEELLVAPLSYLEMIVGFVCGGIIRGLVVGLGVYALALLFTIATIEHFLLFVFYSVSISVIFALLGMLVGLWAKNFEQLSLPSIFLITPLTFLGGMFNSITMMPQKLQFLMRLNPFFYFVDGLRYSMLGIHESNLAIGLGLIAVLILTLGWLVWYLFKIGYRIRE